MSVARLMPNRVLAQRTVATEAVSTMIIRTQLESGVDICWRLSANDLRQVEVPTSGTVLSFSKSDFRFKVPWPLSAERAKSHAVREAESDERMRVVNVTRRHRRIYAVPESRMQGINYKVAPGAQVFDSITDARGINVPLVVGLVASSLDGTQRLVVLQATNPTGQLEMSVSVNPDDVDQAVALFMNAIRLPEDCPRLIFSAREFLDAARTAIAYPSEPDWQGVSVRTIALASITLTLGAAIISAGIAIYYFLQARSALHKSVEVQTLSADTERRIGEVIAAAPLTIAQETSLPLDQVFERAEKVWVPGARVSVQANRTSVDYKVTMPLPGSGGTRTGTSGANHEASLDQINQALELKPPQGCERRDNATTGLANEVQVAITCQDSRPRLSL